MVVEAHGEAGSTSGSARAVPLTVVCLVLVAVGLGLLLRGGAAAGPGVKPAAPNDTPGALQPIVEDGRFPQSREPDAKLDAIQPTASGQGPGPADGAPKTKQLSPIEWKRKWLTDCLADLRAVDPKNAEQQVEHAIVTSIVVLMDAAGTSAPHPPGKMDLRVPDGFQILLHNESVYKFRVGEFPEYDELLVFRARRARWGEMRPRNEADPKALEEWSRSEPEFPQGLVQRSIDRAEESLALIQ
jgi:hypothetical protein